VAAIRNKQIIILIIYYCCVAITVRQEVQIFRAVILPEEDLGQTEIQTVCFVLRFTKNEFISSDAMSKLRQVNVLY